MVFIAPEFSPSNTAGAHRPRLLAKHLPAFGWKPTIVTVRPHCFEGPLDATLERFGSATCTRMQARAELGAPWTGPGPVFFSVRRLVPRMGLDDLIAAAGILQRERFEFRLLIAGEGPERDALERCVREHGADEAAPST